MHLISSGLLSLFTIVSDRHTLAKNITEMWKTDYTVSQINWDELTDGMHKTTKLIRMVSQNMLLNAPNNLSELSSELTLLPIRFQKV
jgi:hypothetical protein